MTRDEFRTLYEFNDWANDRLVAMLYEAFGEETDLYQAEDSRIRSIQRTTVHVIAAQAVWRSRWEGYSPKAMLDPAEYPAPLALRTGFGAERARFWHFFDTLESDAALSRVIHSTNTLGAPRIFPLWQMMQHVITHSMYHRGQVTAWLLDLGHESRLVSTDLITFYTERRGEAFTPDQTQPVR